MSQPYFNPPWPSISFDRAGIEEWIHPDPIWGLITRGVLTKRQVFDCLTSDVDTRNKLIDKMCAKYPAKADLIRLAFTANDTFNPAVTGPDSPALNSTVTYTVQPSTALPAGVTFTGFEVSGNAGGYSIISQNLTTGTLNVKFTSAALFTITANFTLPGNVSYVCAKTIDKRIVPNVPILAVTIQTDMNNVPKVSVINVEQGVTYEWMIDGKLSRLYKGASISILMQQTEPNAFAHVLVKCRACSNGETSDWSEEVEVTYTNPGPVPLHSPVPIDPEAGPASPIVSDTSG